MPGEIGCLEDPAIVCDDTRRADTYAEQRRGGQIDHLCDQGCGGLHGVGASGWARHEVCVDPRVDTPRQVDEGGGEGPMPEVHRDDVTCALVESEERRRLTACRLSLSELTEEVLIDELSDQRRDSGPGETGLARDLRPTRSSLTRHQLQRRPQVLTAGVVFVALA